MPTPTRLLGDVYGCTLDALTAALTISFVQVYAKELVGYFIT